MKFLYWAISLFVFGLIHEFGHILFYRLAGGAKDWRIVMGAGPPIVKLKKITINSAFFAGGHVDNIDFAKTPSKVGLFLFYAGPGLLNIVFVALFHFVFLPLVYDIATLPEWTLQLLRTAMWANVVMAAQLLIPIWIPGVFGPTDGYSVVSLLRSKSMEEHFEKIRVMYEVMYENSIKPD